MPDPAAPSRHAPCLSKLCHACLALPRRNVTHTAGAAPSLPAPGRACVALPNAALAQRRFARPSRGFSDLACLAFAKPAHSLSAPQRTQPWRAHLALPAAHLLVPPCCTIPGQFAPRHTLPSRACRAKPRRGISRRALPGFALPGANRTCQTGPRLPCLRRAETGSNRVAPCFIFLDLNTPTTGLPCPAAPGCNQHAP